MSRLASVILTGGVFAAALGLAGCQKAAQTSSDPYAGLSDAILAWHGDIEATAECAGKPTEGGKGCNSFEVGCKVMEPVTPADKGATAKVVAAMSWSAWNAKRADFDPASGGAEFVKVDGKWVRHDLSGPVNLSTCKVG